MVSREDEVKLKNNEAAYGRPLEAWLQYDTCSVCGSEAICLSTDGSDGEYGGPSFCKPCLQVILVRMDRQAKL